jgi:hypothetical protein
MLFSWEIISNVKIFCYDFFSSFVENGKEKNIDIMTTKYIFHFSRGEHVEAIGDAQFIHFLPKCYSVVRNIDEY